MTDIALIKEKYNIKDFLDFSGIEYQEKKGDLWIKNPYLEQKTGSVVIKHTNNKDGTYYSYFKDFASENRGDIANFAMFYFNLDFKSAIELLKETFNEKNFERLTQIKEENNSFIKKVQENIEQERNNSIEIENIQELKNTALIDYLQKRGIDLATASSAGIKEIYYTNKNNGKKYFSLCFENRKGGVEVRNAYFKGSFGTKDITIFKNENSKEVNIFEGFLDYASAIKLSKNKVLGQNNIILNSVVEADKAVEAIKSLDVDRAKLYLDNDKAGDKAVEEIKEALSNEIEIIDNRDFYKNCNDLNDFLNHKIQQIKEKEGVKNDRH